MVLCIQVTGIIFYFRYITFEQFAKQGGYVADQKQFYLHKYCNQHRPIDQSNIVAYPVLFSFFE